MCDVNTVSAVHDKDKRRPLRSVLMLALTGAYANIVAYGFSFGVGNHEFELPLINWLRDPRLYPNDPIREAFARYPTIFWALIARLPPWMNTEKALLLLFVLTKILFFLALAGMLSRMVQGTGLLACIILSVALSPFMNDLTPLGASDILDSTQTHTSIAIAMLLCAAWLLLEERWAAAAVVCALTVYLSALFFMFMLFAFAIFAVFDWRRHRKEIVVAGLLGGAISVPWLLLFRGVDYRQYPQGYVEALLAFYPQLSTLRGHEAYDLLTTFGLIAAAALLVLIVRASGQRRDLRFEILTLSSLLPVALGIFLAQVHLSPTAARMELLRGDSFLVLYSILLVQGYGANLLGSTRRGPATTFLLGVTAIMMPLSEALGLLWLGLIAMVLWADPSEAFEKFVRAATGSLLPRITSLGLLGAGMIFAWIRHAEWSLDTVLALGIVMGCLLVPTRGIAVPAGGARRIMTVLVGAACLLLAATRVPAISRLWNPVIVPTAQESNWRAVQDWAKSNTPLDAMFLVPTYPGGFRTFSERPSWGEWRDGQIAYHYPPFAEVYRERMMAVGYSWGKWNGTEAITETYKHLPWERLLAVAHQNHLSYIIQFRDVAYPAAPVFANQTYSVYKVSY